VRTRCVLARAFAAPRDASEGRECGAQLMPAGAPGSRGRMAVLQLADEKGAKVRAQYIVLIASVVSPLDRLIARCLRAVQKDAKKDAKKGDKKGKGGAGKGGDTVVTALEGGDCGCCRKPGPCGCCGGSSTSDASIHSKTLDAHSRMLDMLDLCTVHACMHHAAPHARGTA
jgi:hypothetical protein